MNRPLLLDLFCGAGGAARGYHDAGFDVIGVDIKPQPNYPYVFIKADAMKIPLDRHEVDAIHASPPCHDHSALASFNGDRGTGWMLDAAIERLEASGLPYVVENVANADMPGSLVLCGSEFGLGAAGRMLARHRRFTSNRFLYGAGRCHCYGWRTGGVYGHSGGGQQERGYKFRIDDARVAMGIDWMTQAELSQAIPPAYTRFIGEQLLATIGATA